MPDENDPTPLYTALALIAVMDGDEEVAEHWLKQIPRSKRGKVKRGADDLEMLVTRLGKG